MPTMVIVAQLIKKVKKLLFQALFKGFLIFKNCYFSKFKEAYNH
jgi:hypothetical protein